MGSEIRGGELPQIAKWHVDLLSKEMGAGTSIPVFDGMPLVPLFFANTASSR
jgi:hypothetical protein